MKDFETGLSADALRSILLYIPDTGAWFWRDAPCQSIPAGATAGRIRPDGYVQIRIKERAYLAHRLAWLYVTGEWPVSDIDHRNRNRSDNRFVNLRQATRSQNKANAIVGVKTASGIKGVGWFPRTKKWRARIKVRGVSISLGHYDDLIDAIAAYQEAADRYFGEFALAAEPRAAEKLQA